MSDKPILYKHHQFKLNADEEEFFNEEGRFRGNDLE